MARAIPVFRVPAAALDNVRGIGKVRAEVSTETDWDGGAQVTNKLVIDVGGTSGREALDKAAELLIGRNWMVDGENRPTILYMKSTRWKDVSLILRPFFPPHFENHPEVLENLKKASVKEESLVHIEVVPVG